MRLLSIVPLLLFSFWFSSDSIVDRIDEYEFYIPENGRKLVVGEELTYEVNYSIMKLGRVFLKIRDKKEIKGKTLSTSGWRLPAYRPEFLQKIERPER